MGGGTEDDGDAGAAAYQLADAPSEQRSKQHEQPAEAAPQQSQGGLPTSPASPSGPKTAEKKRAAKYKRKRSNRKSVRAKQHSRAEADEEVLHLALRWNRDHLRGAGGQCDAVHDAQLAATYQVMQGCQHAIMWPVLHV